MLTILSTSFAAAGLIGCLCSAVTRRPSLAIIAGACFLAAALVR